MVIQILPRGSLVSEPWSLFQFMSACALRSTSLLIGPSEERFFEISHLFMDELILVS